MPRSKSLTPNHPKSLPSKRSNSLPPRFAKEPYFTSINNPTLSNAAAAAIAGAVKPETKRRQQQAVVEFAIWANDLGLTPDEVLPASETILVEFAASFLGRLAGGTVKAKISCLKAWHTTLGFPWKGGALLRHTLSGVDRQSPLSSHRPERPPVTRSMIKSLHTAWSDSDSGELKCANAGSKCSLLGQLRLGEMFPRHSDPKLFDPRKHPHVCDVSELPPPTPESKYGPLSLFLPSTKTSVSRGDHAHIHAYGGSLNATKTTHIHVADNNLSPDNPLMSYRDDTGNLKVMTKKHFLSLCNEVWSKEGCPRITGHSFRIGGTSLLLQDGIDPEFVKMCGRWKSSAFTRYWRDLHTCASIHIDRVYAHRRLQQRLSN